MSDKLKLLSSIFFLLFSCSKKQYVHTEISCPEKPVTLIRYANMNEIKASIARANELKKKSESSDGYTVIYVSGGRSLVIGVSPENMYKCTMREIPVIHPDKDLL